MRKIQEVILSHLEQYIEIDDKIAQFFREECTIKIYDKKELISKNGQYNRKVHFVREGLVRGFYYENDKEITSSFYTKGSIMANIDTLFSEKPTKYNFEVLEKSEIVSCDYDKLEALCEVSIEYARFSRFILGKLMIQMADRIASLQYMSAKEKYAHLIENYPDIIKRVPLGMVASYLGITQETLSRIRNNI